MPFNLTKVLFDLKVKIGLDDISSEILIYSATNLRVSHDYSSKEEFYTLDRLGF